MGNIKTELEDNITTWVKDGLEDLSRKIDTNPPSVFEFKTLRYPEPEEIDTLGKNVVYLFFAQELPVKCNDAEKAKTIQKDMNAENKKQFDSNCMPQINEAHWGNPPMTHGYCLYVGSCKDNIKNRMKHHIGDLSTTYGLHLDAWWDKSKSIEIFVLQFGENITGGILNLIEDTLWVKYKPLFGKKGPR
ncbi:MAG: hypothetical protein LBV68_08985 [Spirochaetaceae bacterium]|jgi:hypothetical protein|nr:hypothetical protein [Spirochaetaceae bacterium]